MVLLIFFTIMRLVLFISNTFEMLSQADCVLTL